MTTVDPSVLITGFEPFGGGSTNPSGQLVERLADTHPGEVLPVEFAGLRERLGVLLDRWRPGHVVCLGLSAQASGITFERVALNLMDASIPDNAGEQPVDVPVVDGGDAALWATLPVKSMLDATRAAGVPGELSLSAGAYVCNALLYTVLDIAAGQPTATRPRCGFIHLPPTGILDLDTQERGLRAALNTLSGAGPRR
ncbi:pyroglutamyl-peptidase I [Arachnia propionica]|uniref:Pyroglutamyl-peptidase I n=1 Tax=Arachnia propionica TaxID=1750 RepID=A0A3P1TD57_9ACTN|nr:pyroglutamyl-peptidase I [Arachnia propionica]MDO5081922.1 hypothetical protein [Arachnia propionica]RRD07228.1 pyroglutamyl-peptidase I [Arachnia propionica]